MDFAAITYEKSDRIATVTMNRPHRLNAWTRKMGAEMRQAMLDAERDGNVRAIIVTGAGDAFCAGADMAALQAISQGRASTDGAPGWEEAEFVKTLRSDYRTPYSWVLALSKPVIGAINGACVGLGFTHCLYYDFRIASERARMGLIFVRRGLAIEHGASWMLPRIVGLAHAVDLAVTGRLVDAKEALAMGLVSRVVPHEKLMESARELAGEVARHCSPLGVAQAKRLLYRHMFTDLAGAIREDDEAAAMMGRSQDFKEGVRAFMEKRLPRFTGQ
jgi:enoyl-CoA hydratase/carnithine racemase